MGSMPTYHVSKGSEFKFLETELFGNSAFMETYDLALAALADPASTATLTAAANYRHEANPDEVSKGHLKHFRKHWLSAWWSRLAVADTLRAGSIEAITHAPGPVEKPIEVLSVCAQDMPSTSITRIPTSSPSSFHAGTRYGPRNGGKPRPRVRRRTARRAGGHLGREAGRRLRRRRLQAFGGPDSVLSPASRSPA